MRAARIEIEEVWQRVSIELAKYAHEISSVPPPALDCRTFALIPKITFGGISQEASILSEAEARDLWHSQFEPPLPVVSFSGFPAGSSARPRLEDFLPVCGSLSPLFHLDLESEDEIDATGSLDTEIDSEPFPHFYLDVACRFDEIGKNARTRYGSDFGRSRQNVREYIVAAMLDLRTALDCFWPDLPNDAVACFWRSWQAHTYLARFCGQLASFLSAHESAVPEAKVSERVVIHQQHSASLVGELPFETQPAPIQKESSQIPKGASRRKYVDAAHERHAELYTRLKASDGFSLDSMCRDASPRFSKDTFYLYMRGDHHKKVAPEKRKSIETAISFEYDRRFALELSSSIAITPGK